MPRIACIEVPLFPLAARLRSEPELREQAVAVLQGNGVGARVVAATRTARRAGIRPGLTLAQARTRVPKLVARGRDPSCEDAAQQALLDVAESISPRVEDSGEGRIYLDLDGLDRLYPGDDPEHQIAVTLLRDSEAQAGLPVRVGIASSKLAAHMAAGQPRTPNRVTAGEEAAFLAPLPLAQLSPEGSILATLERWGIRSVGDFARLPKDEVTSRLGEAGQALHAIARGLDPLPLVPRPVPPVFREGMELEWPLVNLEPFVFVARGALERISRRMASHGLACTRIELSLDLEPDGHHERALQLPAPSRDVKTLLTLLKLELEARPPNAAVRAFTLTAHPDRPRQAQLTLFGPAALSPDKLATTIARLFSMLGEDRVGSPRTADGHRPERFALAPYTPPDPPTTRPPTVAARGLLTVRVLRPALPLAVLTEPTEPVSTPDRTTADSSTTDASRRDSAQACEVAEPTLSYDTNSAAPPCARPRQIEVVGDEPDARLPRIRGTVRVASGPWQMEEHWWSSEPQERQYWDVEIDGGGLYRIYRDRTDGSWYADGIYD